MPASRPPIAVKEIDHGAGAGGAAAAPPAARAPTLTEIVLRLIWDRRTISRAEIAEETGLSRSTVSEIVASLLTTAIVEETGVGASRGGRRPVVLAFRDRARVLLGVDVGATHVAVVLTDLRGRVLVSRNTDHPVRRDPAGTEALVQRMCREVLDEWGGDRSLLTGVGVAMPSPIDPKRPYAVSPLALPDWNGRHGFLSLREHLAVPVFVENDANAGALAEHWWGAGRGLRSFTYIKVSTGIGAGHIIEGRIFRGASGVAGEIGHVAIDTNGPPCVCGNRGCLQTYAGTQFVLARARALRAEDPGSTLPTGDDLTMDRLVDAALAGDAVAIQVVSETAHYLGLAVSSLLNLLNPAAVLVGGSLPRLGPLVLAPLRETVMRRTFVSSVAAADIRVGELGPLVIAIGAATVVLEAALADPTRLLFDHAP